jgi:hypothetical protein
VHLDPAVLDGMLQPGAVLGGRAFDLEEKRPVDLLDMNAAILNGFDAAGDLDQLASGCCRRPTAEPTLSASTKSLGDRVKIRIPRRLASAEGSLECPLRVKS